MAVRYTDARYFDVTHRTDRDHPRRFDGLAGSIAGSVCGLDVVYDVWDYGRLVLTGFGQRRGWFSGVPLSLQVREENGWRRILGPAIDLWVAPGALQGEVGGRSYDLALSADGDTMRGSVQYRDGSELPFTIHGSDRLARMPAADQAIVLPHMLACFRRFQPRQILELDFRLLP